MKRLAIGNKEESIIFYLFLFLGVCREERKGKQRERKENTRKKTLSLCKICDIIKRKGFCMSRRFMLLIIVISYFAFPKNDTIIPYYEEGFTINWSNNTILHHESGIMMYFKHTYATASLYFTDDVDSGEFLTDFVCFVRLSNGNIHSYNGAFFEPPSEIPYTAIKEVFFPPSRFNVPTFTMMMSKPYFIWFILGWIALVCPPFVYLCMGIRGGNQGERYDPGYDGVIIRKVGLMCLGVALLLYIYHTR